MTAAVAPALLVACLVAAAVLLWPPRGPRRPALSTAATLPSPDGPLVLLRRRLRGRRPDEPDPELLAFVEALGAGLAAGLTPRDAVLSAGDVIGSTARSSGVLAELLPGLRLRAETGERLGAAWAEAAQRHDSHELRLLARAWNLSERTGAPLSAATRTTARLVREGRDARERTATAVAGARTTMTILSILPLGGPALAAVMGLDIIGVYTRSPIVLAALAAGVVLVLVGRAWVGRLVARSLHGPVVR